MPGYSLIELVFVLALVGATISVVAPTVREYRDRAAVVAAREAMVGLLAEARMVAVEAGQATVRIGGTPWSARVETPDTVLRTVRFEDEFGVVVVLSGGDHEAEISFDELGLGRMASQTLGFRRGEAAAEAVVSSYGRVRRR